VFLTELYILLDKYVYAVQRWVQMLLTELCNFIRQVCIYSAEMGSNVANRTMQF